MFYGRVALVVVLEPAFFVHHVGSVAGGQVDAVVGPLAVAFEAREGAGAGRRLWCI